MIIRPELSSAMGVGQGVIDNEVSEVPKNNNPIASKQNNQAQRKVALLGVALGVSLLAKGIFCCVLKH